jgi:replicative DNA helicase
MSIADYSIPNQAEQMPAAPDAEKVVLGAVLLDSSRLLEISAIIQLDDFSLDSNKRIYAAMLKLIERDGSVDTVTLCQYLQDKVELPAVGGWGYVNDLTSCLPTRPELTNYLKILRDKSLYRSMLRICDAIKGRVYGNAESGDEIGSWSISQISEVIERGQMKSDLYDAEEMADDAEYRLLDNPTSVQTLPTGLVRLDEQTGGIMLGELWVIGASPSRGKTTLARQIVKHAVLRNVPTYVHSGEMSRESWFDVTACLIADMPAWKVYDPRLLNPTEKERLRLAIRQLGSLPFKISDAAGITLDRLIWNATWEKRQRNIQLLAVDYAQIIEAPGRDPREQVTNIAQRLRRFAKDEHVAVLLLSQSPRPEGRNINAKPTMFSLKESGALEEAAHTVILPYRPVDPETGKFTEADELIIGKQRRGAIGKVDVKLNGQYLRFEER